MHHRFKQYPNSLRRHRKAAGLRQREVASALGLKTPERITKWENGKAVPKPWSLLKLASLYRVPPQELFDEMYRPIPASSSSFTAEAAAEGGIMKDA